MISSQNSSGSSPSREASEQHARDPENYPIDPRYLWGNYIDQHERDYNFFDTARRKALNIAEDVGDFTQTTTTNNHGLGLKQLIGLAATAGIASTGVGALALGGLALWNAMQRPEPAATGEPAPALSPDSDTQYGLQFIDPS